MKGYQLECRMKKLGNKNLHSNGRPFREPIANAQVPNQVDPFLESAELFNIQHSKTLKGEKPVQAAGYLQSRKKAELSSSKMDESHQSLRQSMEKDKASNLERWRKEAFRYQERVFILEDQASKLRKENSDLKASLENMKHPQGNRVEKRQLSFQSDSQPNKELVQLLEDQNIKLKTLANELLDKVSTISQLEEDLKHLRTHQQSPSFPSHDLPTHQTSETSLRKQAAVEAPPFSSQTRKILDLDFENILQTIGKGTQISEARDQRPRTTQRRNYQFGK